MHGALTWKEPFITLQAKPVKKPKKNGTKNGNKLAKKKASFHRGNPRPSSGPPRADAAEGDSPSSASAEPCTKMVVRPRLVNYLWVYHSMIQHDSTVFGCSQGFFGSDGDTFCDPWQNSIWVASPQKPPTSPQNTAFSPHFMKEFETYGGLFLGTNPSGKVAVAHVIMST